MADEEIARLQEEARAALEAERTAVTFTPAELQPGTLSVPQAAVRLGIASANAYDLIARGEFRVRVLQIGGRK